MLLKMQSAPSIPSHDNVYGYEQVREGVVVKHANPKPGYQGLKSDCIGPGHYEVPSIFSPNKSKGLNWQRSRSKRELELVKNKEIIGPGQYNLDRMSLFPIYKFQTSSVFSSKVPRMLNKPQLMKVKYSKKSKSKKKSSELVDSDESGDEGVPGPGYYNASNSSSFIKEKSPTKKPQVFVSNTERFPQITVSITY